MYVWVGYTTWLLGSWIDWIYTFGLCKTGPSMTPSHSLSGGTSVFRVSSAEFGS